MCSNSAFQVLPLTLAGRFLTMSRPPAELPPPPMDMVALNFHDIHVLLMLHNMFCNVITERSIWTPRNLSPGQSSDKWLRSRDGKTETSTLLLN